MSVSSKLKDGVEKKDFQTIRISLTFALNTNYSDFEDCLEYLKQNNISIESLFVEYEGEPINVDVSSATINDLDKVCAGLSRNFSKQRYDVAVKLSKKLFPPKPKTEQTSQNKSNSNTDSTKKNDKTTSTGVIIGVAAAVAVVATIILLLKKIWLSSTDKLKNKV